jgi:hypothetical protein
LDVDGIGGLEGLRGGDVHVWYAHLELEAGAVGRLAARLSEDERVRAGRFKFARDARRFVVARGTLRSLLGTYLGLPRAGWNSRTANTASRPSRELTPPSASIFPTPARSRCWPRAGIVRLASTWS